MSLLVLRQSQKTTQGMRIDFVPDRNIRWNKTAWSRANWKKKDVEIWKIQISISESECTGGEVEGVGEGAGKSQYRMIAVGKSVMAELWEWAKAKALYMSNCPLVDLQILKAS